LKQYWNKYLENEYKNMKRKENVSAQERVDWAQCDSCHKWRKLPLDFKVEDFQENWYCWKNPDTAHNNCDIEEEKDRTDYHDKNAVFVDTQDMLDAAKRKRYLTNKRKRDANSPKTQSAKSDEEESGDNNRDVRVRTAKPLKRKKIVILDEEEPEEGEVRETNGKEKIAPTGQSPGERAIKRKEKQETKKKRTTDTEKKASQTERPQSSRPWEGALHVKHFQTKQWKRFTSLISFDAPLDLPNNLYVKKEEKVENIVIEQHHEDEVFHVECGTAENREANEFVNFFGKWLTNRKKCAEISVGARSLFLMPPKPGEPFTQYSKIKCYMNLKRQNDNPK